LRIQYKSDNIEKNSVAVSNDHMSPLFLAVVEATEEAIYNSIFMANDMKGYKNREMKSLPIEKTLLILDKYKARSK
ncbi:MAG: P1 family peptidase, partial [Flavobacteriaceae bacterium]|nr:P1 family peptidase [Flavobacteriaceae bacterium]